MSQHPTKSELWSKLKAFQLDDPEASLTFSRRLARENDWSHAFALRVIEEYKRFVFLAMKAGHEVTPSDEVDQAWHLHLTYTQSYWQEMCGAVLGRPLHHGPTKGGKSEGVRFEEQYERTLACYREAFGAEPPEDIWPPARVRFDEAQQYVRINKQHNFIAPKPRLWRRSPVAMMGLAGVGTLSLAPLAARFSESDMRWFLFLAIAGVVGVWILFRSGGGKGRGGCGGFFGCSSGCVSSGCSGGCGAGCGGA